MATHAAGPGCQILWLFASLAFQDGMPTDQYQGEACARPVAFRVIAEREDVGQYLRLDVDVCAEHYKMARGVEGYTGSYARKAVST